MSIQRRTALCAELLLPDCVRLPPDCVGFSCCSPLASASNQLLLPGPIASASTAAPRLLPLPAAAPRLCLLQLLLHARRLHLLQLLLPITSASAAAPRLRPLRLLLPDCMHPFAAPVGFQPDVLKHSSRSSRFSK